MPVDKGLGHLGESDNLKTQNLNSQNCTLKESFLVCFVVTDLFNFVPTIDNHSQMLYKAIKNTPLVGLVYFFLPM